MLPRKLESTSVFDFANRPSSLQAKQHELERQQATDSLRKGLEQRPERDDLVNSVYLTSS